jgi:NAD/NADP transhydrogenase beta subunit
MAAAEEREMTEYPGLIAAAQSLLGLVAFALYAAFAVLRGEPTP